MSKPKPNDQSPESPPRHEHSFEEVIETAQMLYALRPFKRELWRDAWRWKLLAREAFEFLDKLHKACEEVARQRSLQDAAYRRAEKRSAEAEKLPEIVPLKKALREITNQHTAERATKNFKTFVRHNPRYFGGLFGNAPTPQMLNAQIKRWRKTGISRGEVMEFQAVFEKSWPRIIAELNRRKAKKRGAKLNPKDKPLVREVLCEIE
jgi:hypothetical protein